MKTNDEEIRKLETKYSNTHFQSYEIIGKKVTECLKECNKMGFMTQSIKISTEMPFFEIVGLWVKK